MPPKKVATSSLVGEYDKELMTEAELRRYIEALLEEQTRMRKLRNLYQKDKNELGFLKSVQESIIERKSEELQKKWDIQQFIFDSEQKSKDEEFLIRIKELENNDNIKSIATEAFIRVKETQILNKGSEDVLLADISEKDRQIQDLEFIHDLMLVQLKENNFIQKRSLGNIYETTFQRAQNEYDESIKEILPELSRNKLEKLQAVWRGSSESENLFADTIEKMTTYFKDIYWKNIKSVESLFSVLLDLKKDLNTIMLNLRNIQKKNEQLQSRGYKPLSPRSSLINCPTFSAAKVKNFENLQYENYLLSLKLELLKREYGNLKIKFISSMRKIHQKADFKGLLLEGTLLSLQNV